MRFPALFLRRSWLRLEPARARRAEALAPLRADLARLVLLRPVLPFLALLAVFLAFLAALAGLRAGFAALAVLADARARSMAAATASIGAMPSTWLNIPLAA